MNAMTNTANSIVSNPRAVVIYEDRDARGRQVLIARNAMGKVLFQCRRVSAMAGFLRGKKYNFYEYSTLGSKTRKVLDDFRSGFEAKVRKGAQAIRPVKLGDFWPTRKAA